MSYDAIEQRLMELLQGIAGYSSANVSRGDTRILAAGKDKNIILHTGGVPQREVVATNRRIRTNWEILIDLHVRFAGELSTSNQFIVDRRQEVLDRLDGYPTLNGLTGVTHAFVVGAREPELWVGESRNWWKQTFVLQVLELHTAYNQELESGG